MGRNVVHGIFYRCPNPDCKSRKARQLGPGKAPYLCLECGTLRFKGKAIDKIELKRKGK